MGAWDEVPDDVAEMRRRAVYTAFTPAAPVARREVFAGRIAELQALAEVVWQHGQHAVIYGERGVGKTSLAKVAREMVAAERMFSAHITCDGGDDFNSIWRKIFAEIQIVMHETDSTAADFLDADRSTVEPNDVRVILRRLASSAPVVIFIDEFDVVETVAVRRQMAQTIKILADQGVDATVVIVGVAESVTDLINEHASTERNLTQVHMPRMTMTERLEIVDKGLRVVEMTIERDVATRIALMSQGLAHFVHLLAQRSALAALSDDRAEVEAGDLKKAIDLAIHDTHASVSRAYYEAVKANRETLYPNIVLACALASPDERGFFSARAVVDPLTKVEGRRLDIPAFGPHLNRLASERGPVLDKEGEKRRFRYRFVNPLMQPYVLMKGVSEGRIDYTDLHDDHA